MAGTFLTSATVMSPCLSQYMANNAWSASRSWASGAASAEADPGGGDSIPPFPCSDDLEDDDDDDDDDDLADASNRVEAAGRRSRSRRRASGSRTPNAAEAQRGGGGGDDDDDDGPRKMGRGVDLLAVVVFVEAPPLGGHWSWKA
jgi:hypothetical protein